MAKKGNAGKRGSTGYAEELEQEYRLIIIGAGIILAVAMDRLSEHIRQRRLTRRLAHAGEGGSPRSSDRIT